jgi:hypothetical protein
MEPWCGDIMGKRISSVEPCIGSKEHYIDSCVYLIVGGFGFGSVGFFNAHSHLCIVNRDGMAICMVAVSCFDGVHFMHHKL